MDKPPFTCAICQRDVSMRWWVKNEPWAHQAPVCIVCERSYGRQKMPPFGAFRDRRMANQILALGNALESSARRATFHVSQLGGPDAATRL